MINLLDKRNLIILFPVLFVLFPKPGVLGLEPSFYFVILISLTISTIYFVVKIKINKSLIAYILILLFILSTIYISYFFSATPDLIGLLKETIKYILIILVFINSYMIGRVYKEESINSKLILFAIITLFLQIIFVFTQLLDIKVFNYFYSMHKSRPLGGMLRVVGTLINPNLFSWIVMQTAVLILLLIKNKFKIVLLILCFIMIILSGSRSSLILFPLLITFVYILNNRRSIKFYFIQLPIIIIFLSSFSILAYKLLEKYQEYFPYLSQILSVFQSGELSSVNSYSLRIGMWNNGWNLFNHESGFIKYFFGIGPNQISVMDNDFLISYINNGIVYTISIYGFILYLLIRVMFIHNKVLKILLIQCITFTIIISFQSDTMIGWNYPLFIMFFAGLSFGNEYRIKETKFKGDV